MARPRSHSSEGRDSHPGLKAEVSCGAGAISFPAAVALGTGEGDSGCRFGTFCLSLSKSSLSLESCNFLHFSTPRG